MKSARVKYEEAVIRNLATFRASAEKLIGAAANNTEDFRRLVNLTVEAAKIKIGIKKIDNGLDPEIKMILDKAHAVAEKIFKKEKKEKAAAGANTTSTDPNIDALNKAARESKKSTKSKDKAGKKP